MFEHEIWWWSVKERKWFIIDSVLSKIDQLIFLQTLYDSINGGKF